MLNLVQNLRIGTKLAISSALGILLVLAMIAGQVIGNGNVRRSSQTASEQQELAREAVESKLAARAMQLAARDIRLANNSDELQKARDALVERAGHLVKVADAMLTLSHVPENRARIEKLKVLTANYLKGAQQLASVRGAALALTGEDAAARLAKLVDEGTRLAREVTLPIAGEMDQAANQIADVARHRSEEEVAASAREMASSEHIAMVIGVFTALVLLCSWLMSFLTIARPIRALTVAMDKLAGGDFSVVLPGLAPQGRGRWCRGGCREVQDRVRTEGARGGRGQDQAGSGCSRATQGRDVQAGRWLRGGDRRDRRHRVIGRD
ncbi:CHASE3 domain sensor protein [Bradyrhizobium ottawaense]